VTRVDYVFAGYYTGRQQAAKKEAARQAVEADVGASGFGVGLRGGMGVAASVLDGWPVRACLVDSGEEGRL
jgi:hypothetical protein